jgi:Lecithin retinol acyltransferase
MRSGCRDDLAVTGGFTRGDIHDTQISKRERSPSTGIHSTDRLLAGNQEPPLGSHLVTPRRGYLHHGIYVGGRKVVHYSGLAHGLRGGPVEEVPLSHFASTQCVWIRSNAPSDFDVREVICRARSRVGEDCYRLLTNNCEHFCEWCLRGTPRSLQVEAWLAWPRRMLRAAFRPILRSLVGSDPLMRRATQACSSRAERARC